MWFVILAYRWAQKGTYRKLASSVFMQKEFFHSYSTMFQMIIFNIPASFILTVFGTMLVTILLYIKLCLSSCENLPKLYYKESTFNSHILHKCLALKRPFKQKWLTTNAHIQTLLWIFLPRAPVRFEREYLQMSDKGVIALDWTIEPLCNLKRSSPLLLVFPGITSDSQSVGQICVLAMKKGFRTVVFNYRGHGNSYLTTSKLQSFGDPQDVRQVIQYIRQKHPKSQLFALSVSSGSIPLFSYLGEYGSSAHLKASVFISPIYEISELTLKSLPWFYEFLLLMGLKRILLKHSQSICKHIDIMDAMQSWNILTYIEKVYTKFSESGSINQYLERFDPMRDVDDISVPVMCINSKDDPIWRQENIPYDIFQYYPNMILVSSEKGGHCGFYEGDGRCTSWAEDVSIEYLLAVLEFNSLSFKE